MAQLFAAMHPERVDRLVLINSAVGLAALDALPAYRRDGDPEYGVDDMFARIWRTVETWGRTREVMVRHLLPEPEQQPGGHPVGRALPATERQPGRH